MAIVKAEIIRDDDDELTHAADYEHGSAHRGKAVISVNLNFLTLDAVRRYKNDPDAARCFEAEFAMTLAHELFHVAQDVYGNWLSEYEVEKVMAKARPFLANYQYTRCTEADAILQMQDRLYQLAHAVVDVINAMPVKAKRGKAFNKLEQLMRDEFHMQTASEVGKA